MFSLYQKNYHNSWGGVPLPDSRDHEIAEKTVKAYNDFKGPRVGDFVITPEGKTQRFSHEWPDKIQTCDEGSFHISQNGYVSMSGGLDPGYKKEQIAPTEETKLGHFWFFHHNDACGSNSVGLIITCRVFKVI